MRTRIDTLRGRWLALVMVFAAGCWSNAPQGPAVLASGVPWEFREIETLYVGQASTRGVIIYGIDWSPDGRYVALATYNGIEVFEVPAAGRGPSAAPLNSVAWWEEPGAYAIRFHPSGKWFACGFWDREGKVQIRAFPDGKLLKELHCDTDGERIPGTDEDRADNVRVLQISPDGSRLLVTTEGDWKIWVYDTATWEVAGVLRKEAERVQIISADFSALGNSIYVGANREKGPPNIEEWTLAGSSRQIYSDDRFDSPASWVGRSRTDDQVAAVVGHTGPTQSALGIGLWDSNNGKALPICDLRFGYAYDFAPTTSLFAVGDDFANHLHLVDGVKSEVVLDADLHAFVRALRLSPDGRRVAAATGQGSFIVLDCPGGSR